MLPSEARSQYELCKCIDTSSYQTNNDIELFFIERAKQLLKPNGVASLILPSTVLTNSGILYEKARNILVENFVIIAIVQYPSGTFFKTKNTDTIAIFIKKRDNKVNLIEHYENRINLWFQGDFSKDKIFRDNELISGYCKRIGIDEKDYRQFLLSKKTKFLSQYDYYEDYKALFDKTVSKKISKKKEFSKLSVTDQEELLNKEFVKFFIDSEKQKLLFYIFGCNENSPIVFVKSPNTAKKIKEYLGYEWNTKEGIKYIGYDNSDILVKNKGINNIDTPLFNPNNFNDITKVNTIIQKLFEGDKLDVSDELKEYLTFKELNDLIDYDKASFDRQINVLNTTVEFETPYKLEPLHKLLSPIGGLWTSTVENTKPVKVIRNTNFSKHGQLLDNDIETITASVSELSKRTLKKGDIIIEKSGGSKNQAVGRVVYFDLDGEYSFSNFTARLRLESNEVHPKYVHIILNYIYLSGYTFAFQNGSSGLKNLKLPKYLGIKIPVPDKKTQRKIIDSVLKLDKKFETQRLSIEQYTSRLVDILEKSRIIGG